MILTKNDINERMSYDISDHRSLHISPLLNKGQIGNDTIDIRLGTYFMIFQQTSIDCIKLSNVERQLSHYQNIVHIPLGEEIIIPPQTLILGTSLEYIKLPSAVYGEVGTRSSWGRLGLVIATAVNIHPNFRGCLTLELVNHGIIPIALSPGVEIGQLVLHQLTTEIIPSKKFYGKYLGCVMPEFTKIFEEHETINRLKKISGKYHGQF
jgi:dCTP deaminase